MTRKITFLRSCDRNPAGTEVNPIAARKSNRFNYESPVEARAAFSAAGGRYVIVVDPSERTESAKPPANTNTRLDRQDKPDKWLCNVCLFNRVDRITLIAAITCRNKLTPFYPPRAQACNQEVRKLHGDRTRVTFKGGSPRSLPLFS